MCRLSSCLSQALSVPEGLHPLLAFHSRMQRGDGGEAVKFTLIFVECCMICNSVSFCCTNTSTLMEVFGKFRYWSWLLWLVNVAAEKLWARHRLCIYFHIFALPDCRVLWRWGLPQAGTFLQAEYICRNLWKSKQEWKLILLVTSSVASRYRTKQNKEKRPLNIEVYTMYLLM